MYICIQINTNFRLMKICKIVLLINLGILLNYPMFSEAQIWHFRDKTEYFVGFGATNFLGDLGGTPRIGSDPFSMRDFDWPSTRPLINVGYRYRFDTRMAASANLFAGYLSGDDRLTENPYRNNRNLHFRSPIIELSAQFEFLMTQQREGARYSLQGIQGWTFLNIESYLLVGLGGFYFNPKAKYRDPINGDGKWYHLRPIGTEGQTIAEEKKMYSRFQIAIPLGIGLKYALDENWSIGIEYGLRKTFTDYIDDVSSVYFDNEAIRQQSGDVGAYLADPHLGKIDGQTNAGFQRGDPTDLDSYMFATIKVFYKFKGGFMEIPKFW